MLLTNTLGEYGEEDDACRLFDPFVVGREKAVEWNGVTSKLIEDEHGVPRGSVVIPLLFVLSTLLNSVTGGSTAEM